MSNLEPLVRIGKWYYQAAYGHLWLSGVSEPDVIRLEPRLHALLNYFLLNPNQLLSKDTLIDYVWPQSEGTDAAVMRAVGALRKVLDDDVKAPFYIATVSKKGYCWLAEIEPLTSQQAAAEFTDTDNDIEPRQAFPWRFALSATFFLLLSCGSLAYLLASFTTAPLTKLPELIKPVSALSGMEYWPLLSHDESVALYQHQAPAEKTLSWLRQDLQSLQIKYSAEAYRQLSSAVWLQPDTLLFRAISHDKQCAFYTQQVLPVFSPAIRVASCQSFITQGLQPWRDNNMIWLDFDGELQRYQLWSFDSKFTPTLLFTMNKNWLAVNHMLINKEYAYLLVRTTFFHSQLVAVDLNSGEMQHIASFPFNSSQMSWWNEQTLLLSEQDNELILFELKSRDIIRLGVATQHLQQATRYQHRVLATQSLDYKTDLLQLKLHDSGRAVTLSPWQVSNRSEKLIAASADSVAFVSERAGHNQIWLVQQQESRPLTNLTDRQYIQQLLWHQQQLLALINNELFQVDMSSGSLKRYPYQSSGIGRYHSCGQTLYWTEYEAEQWRLMSLNNGQVTKVMVDVTDARCTTQGVVLQFSNRSELALLHHDVLEPLPVSISWRQYEPEQWLADDSGIYWLDTELHGIQFLPWGNTQPQFIRWPSFQLPVAIYSNGKELSFAVRPRPYDTDIVWLENKP